MPSDAAGMPAPLKLDFPSRSLSLFPIAVLVAAALAAEAKCSREPDIRRKILPVVDCSDEMLYTG